MKDHETSLSYTAVQRLQQKAQRVEMEEFAREYGLVRPYLRAIADANPGSVWSVTPGPPDNDSEPVHFKCAFLALASSKRALAGALPQIFLDGTALHGGFGGPFFEARERGSGIDDISVWDDDDGTVTLGLQLSYRGDQTASGPNSSGFQANLTAEYPFRTRGIGRCVLPVDVTITDVSVEFDLRLSWTPKSTSHHFRFWFASPSVRANTSVQLGSAPKTTESPLVISSLRLLDAVLASVVHPNSFRWAVHCRLPFTAHHAAPRRQPSVSTPKLTSPPIPQSHVIRRKRRL
ncbi:hypothetical protein DIPPA_17546 [Diplonema papillatum]|nr:hypothetical protein DIPPA_17546 [Diplonema papillatum]